MLWSKIRIMCTIKGIIKEYSFFCQSPTGGHYAVCDGLPCSSVVSFTEDGTEKVQLRTELWSHSKGDHSRRDKQAGLFLLFS